MTIAHPGDHATSGISYTSLTPALSETWDSLCAESGDGWFWHTSAWLEYNLAYGLGLDPVSVSFLAYANGCPIAVCPIVVRNESVDDLGARVIAYPSGHGMIPALASCLPTSRRKAIWRACLSRIDEIAAEHHVKQVTLWTTPLSESGRKLEEVSEQFGCLRRAGYLETAWLTQIVDLSSDEQVLLRHMRKGHRYDVKRGGDLFRMVTLAGPQVDRASFDVYAGLHELAAGRKTRPQQTFDMMYSWILRNQAMLTLAWRENTCVGAALVITDKDAAYYASSCVHPAHIDEPVGHALQWATMRELRVRGLRRYELGHLRYGPLPQDVPSAKEIHISHFERGFGGGSHMFLIAEKHYDQQWYETQARTRLDRYASAAWRPREVSTGKGA